MNLKNKKSKSINRHLNSVIISCGIISLPAFQLRADTLSFSQVLNRIEVQSPVLQSLNEKMKSDQIASERSQNHWAPKLYLDFRSYNSNDPATAFMTKLQQQQIENSDFATSSLNSPDRVQAQKGSVTLDWHLYEGNRSTVLSEMSQQQIQLTKLNQKQNKNNLQSEVFKMYFSVVQLQIEKNNLEEIKKISDKILNDYQLRKNENPVGYSGFLGLKSLKLQIDSRLETIEQQKQIHFDSLNFLMADPSVTAKPTNNENTNKEKNNENWSVELNSFNLYKNKIETLAKNWSPNSESPQLQTAVIQKNMAEKNKELELSFWKPQVGAFAEAYTLSGNKGTGTGNTLGVYVRWGFDSQLIGNQDQAKKQALAADYFVKATQQKIFIQNQALIQSNQIFDSNIVTIKKSLELLQEQTAMMKKLYQSGAINSLQLTEVYLRQFQLVRQYSELQSEQINIMSNLIQIYGLNETTEVSSEKQ